MGEIPARVVDVPRHWCEWFLDTFWIFEFDLIKWLVKWSVKYRFLRWVFTERVTIPARHFPDNVCLWNTCRKEAFGEGPNGGWYCPRHLRTEKREDSKDRVKSMEKTLIKLMLTVPHHVRIEERGNIVSAIQQIHERRKFRDELEAQLDAEEDAEDAARRAVEDRT